MRTARDAGMIHLRADDEQLDGRIVHVDGTPLINFVSCSYLGLELDPRVVGAVHAGVDRYGVTFSVSRSFISAPRYAALEDRLAQLTGTFPVVTSSTTLGHFAFLTTLIQHGDILLLDQQVHASVHMATQVVASKAKIVTVRHNNMERLEREVLRALAESSTANVWYFGDGIYSMHGDVAPMPALVALLERYDRFHVYLDDAHGSGACGPSGRGHALGAFDTMHPRMVVALSLGKALGVGTGGVLCFASRAQQDLVRSCGMPMIFCAPLPPPLLEACIASAEIMLSADGERMQTELRDRIAHFRACASEAGLTVASDPVSPVQYIVAGSIDAALQTALAVKHAGFLVNPCGYPAVARNHAGIRLTMTRHQSFDDIAAVVHAISAALEEHAPELVAATLR
jgi:7-keto-8-aminopelargonate synthetase-like enzyme